MHCHVYYLNNAECPYDDCVCFSRQVNTISGGHNRDVEDSSLA